MKVYTKTGDKGETSLFGGSRISKGHLRIHAYGTVDELNSYIGLLSDLSPDESRKSELLRIQDRLFTLGALLATENEASKKRLPSITLEDISFLEASIDRMEESLEPIKTFSSIYTIPNCGVIWIEPIFFKSKPNPVLPIVEFSPIIVLSDTIEFFTTVLCLINTFFPISTPLPIIQFF